MSNDDGKRPPHPFDVFSPLLLGAAVTLGTLAVIVTLVAIWAGPTTQNQWSNTAGLLGGLTALPVASMVILWLHKDGRL